MKFWIYLLIMAGVTYLIRALPLTLIRRELKNKTLRSFLFYVPYVTLAVMTFPSILRATDSAIPGAVALAVAVVLAWLGQKLPVVAGAACLVVLVAQWLLL